MTTIDAEDRRFLDLAIEQARLGRDEGGIPVGAVLAADGEVLGAGRNQRLQLGSLVRHAETGALDAAGILAPDVLGRATMYTTLSPCPMCSGAMLFYGIPRMVIGEHRTKVGEEALLISRGVELVVVDDPACFELMQTYVASAPEAWTAANGGGRTLTADGADPAR
jgi:cytosine/creatinine deaminase